MQLDLTNYDQVLNHARMRLSFIPCNGRPLSFENAAMIHMSHTIQSQNQQATAKLQPPKRGRGRPQAFTRKRQRFDAWHAFVQLNKPVRDGPEAAVDIRSSDHLRELGSRWRAMSAADREEYKSIAASQQVALQLTPGHDAEGSSQCAAPLAC